MRCFNSVVLLFLMGAAFSQERPRTLAYQFSHAAVMDPTFSPDGKEMIYIMVIAGEEQLMRRTLDRSRIRQLTTEQANHEDPAWSPDGKHVAFGLIRDGLEQIQMMNPDGSGVVPVSPVEVRAIHPSWSPDSRKIL